MLQDSTIVSTPPQLDTLTEVPQQPSVNTPPVLTTFADDSLFDAPLPYANPLPLPATDTIVPAEETDTLSSAFLLDKYGFFSGSQWIKENEATRFVGMSGDPVPYKLSNDVYVTGTLLLCMFLTSFVISRSMHAIALQVKQFFYNRNRNETFSLKSEGEVRNNIFVVLLESFVLSLLFFSYAEFKISDSFTTVSPYLLLFTYMAICLGYFGIKFSIYGLLNWTFFSPPSRETWFNSYNLTLLGKAVTLLPLVLLVLYFNLPTQVYINLFACIVCTYEVLILYKTKQIFFSTPLGILPSFLYFCSLEVIPLLFLWQMLIRAYEFMMF